MSYRQQNGRVFGVMPNGRIQEFSSVRAYEDAWIDAMFSSLNELELEIPESW